jgi:hypothetical protein
VDDQGRAVAAGVAVPVVRDTRVVGSGRTGLKRRAWQVKETTQGCNRTVLGVGGTGVNVEVRSSIQPPHLHCTVGANMQNAMKAQRKYTICG